ncbi:hypothetical protein DFH06DRAFT_214543 [Mycena polygramma]|nr:hypothetical protein DFH06DRAFT_214543 [Mycena polygramma]
MPAITALPLRPRRPLISLKGSTRQLDLRIPLRRFNRSYTVRPNSSGQLPEKTGGQSRHIISTLNPDRIIASDCIDVSNRRTLTIRFPHSPGKGTTLCFKLGSGGARHPFPDNTSGFLYYDRHPHAALLEGSIRLRVTPDPAPASFPLGQDLFLPPGTRWQITLPQIALRGDFTNLRNHLLHENLVTLEQLSQCRRLFAKSTRIHPPTTIFRLDQEFHLELSTPPHITVVGKRLHRFRAIFFEARVNNKTSYPWAGSVIVRFEPSTSSQHTGRRVVNLRLVKLLTPVLSTFKGYRGRISRPEEGQLLTLSHYRAHPAPWACDIDCDTTAIADALRDLWDNSPLASGDHSQSAPGEPPNPSNSQS